MSNRNLLPIKTTTSSTEQHHDLLAKEEAYHIQCAKKRWAILGDRNTSFFRAIILRNRKNHITHLTNLDGSHSTTPDQITSTLAQYFKSIFSTQSPSPIAAQQVHYSASAIPPSNYSSGHHVDTAIDSNSQFTHLDNDDHDNQDNKLYTYTYSMHDINEIHSIVR